MRRAAGVTVLVFLAAGAMLLAGCRTAQRASEGSDYPRFGTPVVVDGFRITATSAQMSDEVPKFDYKKSSDTRTPAEREAADHGPWRVRSDEGGFTDTWLAVYLTMTNVSKRPREPGNFEVFVVDDEETYSPVDSTYCTFGHTPMRPGQTYSEMVLCRASSNARTLYLALGEEAIEFPAPPIN